MEEVVKLDAVKLDAHTLGEVCEGGIIQLNRMRNVIYILAAASLEQCKVSVTTHVNGSVRKMVFLWIASQDSFDARVVEHGVWVQQVVGMIWDVIKYVMGRISPLATGAARTFFRQDWLGYGNGKEVARGA